MAKLPKASLQKATHKKAMLEALEKSLGVVTTACKAVGIERTTHYRYMNDDAEDAKAVADIENIALDFAESKLHGQIQKGDTTATIFYLKTKGKKRGYVERQERMEIADGAERAKQIEAELRDRGFAPEVIAQTLEGLVSDKVM